MTFLTLPDDLIFARIWNVLVFQGDVKDAFALSLTCRRLERFASTPRLRHSMMRVLVALCRRTESRTAAPNHMFYIGGHIETELWEHVAVVMTRCGFFSPYRGLEVDVEPNALTREGMRAFADALTVRRDIGVKKLCIRSRGSARVAPDAARIEPLLHAFQGRYAVRRLEVLDLSGFEIRGDATVAAVVALIQTLDAAPRFYHLRLRARALFLLEPCLDAMRPCFHRLRALAVEPSAALHSHYAELREAGVRHVGSLASVPSSF